MLCILLYSPFSLVSLVVLSDCTVFFFLLLLPLYPFLRPSLTFCLFLHFYPSTLLLLLKRSLFVLPDWMHEYTSVFYSSLVQHHPQIHKIPLATFELLHPFLPTYLPFRALLRLYYDTFTKLVLALQADTSSSPSCVTFLA